MGLAQGHYTSHVGDVTSHVGEQEGLRSMLDDGRFEVFKVHEKVLVHVHQHHPGSKMFDGARHRSEGEGVEQDHVTGLHTRRTQREEHGRPARVHRDGKAGAKVVGKGTFQPGHPRAFGHVFSVAKQACAFQHGPRAFH